MTVIDGNCSPTIEHSPIVHVAWFDEMEQEHRSHFPPECLDLCELVEVKNTLEYAG